MWADMHQQQMERWPNADMRPIEGAPGETLLGVNYALRLGRRGLPGSSSPARLLAGRRGVPIKRDLPPLTADTIRAWADLHRQSTGRKPTTSHLDEQWATA
jgi:hypothetical protein